jgi:hypothetical protein
MVHKVICPQKNNLPHFQNKTVPYINSYCNKSAGMIAFQGNTSTKSVAQNANFCDISLLKIFEQICWRNTIKKCSKNKRYTAKKLMWSLVYLQRSRGGAACEVAFRVGFPGHAVRTDGWKERYSWGTKGKK